MARARRGHKRPYGQPHEPLDLERIRGGQKIQTTRDGQWLVREVVGQKMYTCPGCHQDIPVGTNHIVAWPYLESEQEAVAQRRHWHSGCWQIRATRGW